MGVFIGENVKKLTITDMRTLAEIRGGTCLSKEFINRRTKLRWQCNHKHEWDATPDNVIRKTWCPFCGREKSKKTIEDMQLLANKRGGKCLSKVYIDGQTKLEWQCADEHTWRTTPTLIKQGHWCRKCSGRKKPIIYKNNINDIILFAAKKDREIVDIQYVGHRHKYRWKCRYGHINQSTIIVIKRGKMVCLECNQQNTMKEMQKIAEDRGGKCLSTNYSNCLLWECNCGYQWKAAYHRIKYGGWCPKCAKKISATSKEVHEIAASRRGKCLSPLSEFVLSLQKLNWQCENGHIWEAKLYQIKSQKTWCPYCFRHVSENKCRFIFEQTTGKNFPTIRPNRYEFDGCNMETRVAFEYQGQQHYHKINYFNKNISLKQIKKRDSEKVILANKMGIRLLVIPYWIAKRGDCYLVEYIQSFLGIKKEIDFSELQESISYLKKIQDLATNKGGKCLTEYYVGWDVPVELKCEKGHKWKSLPYNILYGHSWCPYCAGVAKKTIEDMQKLAKKNKGQCLSKIYITMDTKLMWMCKNGHKWEMRPSCVRDGLWCSQCNKIRRFKNVAINKAHEIFGRASKIGTLPKLNTASNKDAAWIQCRKFARRHEETSRSKWYPELEEIATQYGFSSVFV